MKYQMILAGFAAALAAGSAVPAEAGPFDKLKKKVEKVKKKAEEVKQAVDTVEQVVDTVENGGLPATTTLGSPLSGVRAVDGSVPGARNYPRTASAGNYAGRAGPVPAKYASLTKCARLGIGNAFVAQQGNYTFSQGLSTETRGGLVERQPVSVSDGCVLPAMGTGDVLYVEFDRNRFNKYDYALQCVSYDGSQQLDNTNAPSQDKFTGKDVMLHTGHSLGYEPTATGSNSDRSAAYDAHLASRGRAMVTFNMPNLHQDKKGTDFYCQHYNKKTGESALAFAFRRGPVFRK